MRITCTSTADGNVYLFHRSDMGAYFALKPIVPFLLASHANVVIGSSAEDPSVLLCVGPISGKDEATLLVTLRPYLSTGSQGAVR